MNIISSGYTSLLIAHNKEKVSAMISLVALLINIVLGLFFVKVVKVEFSYVIIATLLTYLIFSFLCVWKGRAIICQPSVLYTLKVFFPIRLLIPYLGALFIAILKLEYLIWMPLALYLILNWSDLKTMKSMVLKIINNPNIVDI